MYLMYDSVDISQIPKNPHAVLYYVNGHEGVHTEPEMREKFPNAHLLGLSVTGVVAAHGYDVESGDYSPSQVGALFQAAKEKNIWRPCFYGSLSIMPEIRKNLNAIVKARDDVRLLVADWDDTTIIPSWADGKQFTNHALDRNLDESIVRSTFFVPFKKPEKKDIMNAQVSFDLDGRSWQIKPLPAGSDGGK